MNDRELMKRIYDRECADEMSAEEILSKVGRGAQVSTTAKYAGLAAAAVICIVAIGGFLWLKNADDNKLTPAESVSQSTVSGHPEELTREKVVLDGAYDSEDDGKMVFYRQSDGKTVSMEITEEMKSQIELFDLLHGDSMIRSKNYDIESIKERIASADIVARVCYISANEWKSKICLTKLYSSGQIDGGFIVMYEDKDGIKHYSDEGYRTTDKDSYFIDESFDVCYQKIAEQLTEKAETVPAENLIYTDRYLNSHAYLRYRDDVHFTYNSGLPETIFKVTKRPLTDAALGYLSGLEPVGVSMQFGSYLHSNCLSYPNFVFKSKTSDTFYAYTGEGIYKFGTDEEPDMTGEPLDIPEPKSHYVQGEYSYYFRYNGKRFTYASSYRKEYYFNDQSELFCTDKASLLDGSVFLGIMIDDRGDGIFKNGVTGDGAEYGSAIFYNSEKEMMTAILLDSDYVGLHVITYSPENRAQTD